jgi:dihydroorotate dehydrogenase electron transfer subunit
MGIGFVTGWTIKSAAIIPQGKCVANHDLAPILKRMLDKKVRVSEVKHLGGANHLLTLDSPDQARKTQPGHFVMIKCSDDVQEDPLLRRPFSVFDIRRNRTGRVTGLDILVKDVGIGTRRLVELQPGDKVHSLGPQGQPFRLPDNKRGGLDFACLVAGGVGIAALYLLARALIARRITPVLFYGGRTAADLVLRDYFERLGIETHYTTENGSMGQKGLVIHPVERFLERHSRSRLQLFSCGPWGMMKAAHELAARHNVDCEVSLEARMGCSLGACMGCVIRAWDEHHEEQYLRVCLEGPVMNSRTVDWDTPPL